MKIMTRKAQKTQQERQEQQIINAAQFGYSRGYNRGLGEAAIIADMTIGAAVLLSAATSTIVTQAYRRKMLKYADNNFNLDKTFAKLTNDLYSIVSKDPKKGYKEFTKFLFKHASKGFELYNQDVCKLIMIAGFDHFRDHVSEMGNLTSTLKGDGAVLIKDAYDTWLDHGVNVFPFGPSAGWKGLLAEDYAIAADLNKFNAIVNKYLCGAMQKIDVIEGNQIIVRLQTQYATHATEMNAQNTMQCAEYCNAHHFGKMITEGLVKICRNANITIDYNETALVVTQFTDANIGGSPIVIEKRVGFVERQFNKLFHKDGQRTMVPPQNSTAAQPTPQAAPATPAQPQYDSAAEDASEQNLKALARAVAQTKTRNDRKAARNKLSVAIDKHCNTYGYSRTEFVNQMPELKGVC